MTQPGAPSKAASPGREAAGASPLASLSRSLPAGRELPNARRFLEAWSRTQAALQVDRALSRQPAQAGPLNSHALVLQALDLLQDLSPAYLQRVVQAIEAVEALERMGVSASPARAARPRPPRPVKTAR